ncbi:UDP-Glycosyltransferase/glycogen phosphorylase [Aureobasidium sp. EXF-10728]|nr:UDP-Glycosyltransferase/glycogen phosphorylase [Aureobasidium sp. EXF-10728]
MSSRRNTPQARRRVSMELPERFRFDDDADQDQDQDQEVDRAQIIDMAMMHQSVFGIIAATQSKANTMRSMLQEADSDSDDTTRTPPTRPNRSTVHSALPLRQNPLSRNNYLKRASDNNLVQSLPGLRPAPTTTFATTTPSRFSQPAVDSPETTPHAGADLGSSQSTIRKPASRKPSPVPDMSSSTTQVALPDALKDIFNLDEAEKVVAKYPCWYLQSVLLQGYIYITQRHICFYAYLQKKTGVTIKSGYLTKRGQRNPRYKKYWFVLKGDVLSYYKDSSTPFSPRDVIDLRYGVSADITPIQGQDKESASFSVVTDAKTYHFKAETAPNATEWVKQIQKVIFRSRNNSDSVKICLPVDNVVDIEESNYPDFADTIKIRVIDNDETFAVDEYFFSFFGFGEEALGVLRSLTQETSAQRVLASRPVSPVLTMSDRRPSSVHGRKSRVPSMSPAPGSLHENVMATLSPASGLTSRSARSSSELERSTLDLTQGREDNAANRSSKQRGGQKQWDRSLHDASESYVSSSDQGNDSEMSESAAGTDASGSHILSGSIMFHKPTIGKHHDNTALHDAKTNIQSDVPAAATKKTGNEPGANVLTKNTPETQVQDMQQSDSSTLGGLIKVGAVPIQRASGFLYNSGKRVSGLFGGSPLEYYDKFSGMIAGGKKHYAEADELVPGEEVQDSEDEMTVREAEKSFRNHFALPDSEKLVATFFGFFHRVLPLYGKLYVGSTRLCFRSFMPGNWTKLVVPFKDIMDVDKERGFRFGYSGMVVVIRGHEEIFFEFGSQDLRDDCTVTLLRSLDSMEPFQESILLTEDEKRDADAAAAENLLLQEARQGDRGGVEFQLPQGMDQPGTTVISSMTVSSTNVVADADSPAVSFDDPAASVLDFKPEESLRITCLTIGSRGDVQPYIALCKGLLAEGHRPKIASHAEFGDWVRSHGIDFAPVEGNPAELMALCVDHGMFTPSFLYETNQKFWPFVRGLLKTAWAACQDSDLLIESPSAMAGIHIAEALGIPYFRAFTMPWTRTRAYPHAFGMQKNRMGGAYNYMTYVLFENIFWKATSSTINKWRKEDLGLKATNMEKMQQDKVPFFYNFSPSVVVPPLDFGEWIRVTGYWFLDEADNFTPQKELLEFIKKARTEKAKLVYIGFGSVVVPDPKQLTLDIIAAVKKADVRCILSKGWSDRMDKKDAKALEVPLPDFMFQIASAPHDWLFRQVDAAVHHGGAGTTGASLRAGIPTIIKPFFGDQFFFGSKVQDLGVGRKVLTVTENALGKAIWIATHDSRMIEKARVLGEQIRSENGVGTVIKAIYRDMEYAKTLVQQRVARAAQGDTDAEDEEEVEVEDSWTLVENDSDPDATSPTAMMQPQSPGKGKAKMGLRLPLSRS